MDFTICSGLKIMEQMRAAKTESVARMMIARVIFCTGVLEEGRKRALDECILELCLFLA